MYGIFGYVTNKEEALGLILIAAAERLTYRGYDSVGDVKYNVAEMRGQHGITQLRRATIGSDW